MNSYYAKSPKQIVLEEKKIMCMVEHIYLTSSLFAKVSFSCMFKKFGGGGKLCTFKTSKVQEILENKMQNVGACAIRLITVPTTATVFVYSIQVNGSKKNWQES